MTPERAAVPLVAGDDAPAARTSWGAAVAAIGVCALAFFATCALLSGRLPLPRASRLSPKLEHFAEHKDEYDAVFVGSSKVYRHVDPALFDELTPQRGPSRRSFNLGVSGMAAIEIHFAIRTLLELRPERLRWVIVDPHTLGLDLLDKNMLTGRVTFWHDVESTWMASRFIAQTPRPWLGDGGRLALLAEHWLSFAYNVGNVGRLRIELERLLAGTSASRAADRRREAFERGLSLGPREDGHLTLDDELARSEGDAAEKLRVRVEVLEERAEEFVALRRKMLTEAPAARALQSREAELLTRIADDVEAAGARAVFFTSPDLELKQLYLRAAARAGVVDDLLDLSDASGREQLLQRGMWFDWQHLNARGVGIYTRALAEDFAKLLSEGSASGPRDGDADRDDESADPEPGTSARPGAGSDRDGGQRR